MLKAGIKFEKGIGRGSDRKAEDKIIANPQMIWEPLVLVSGCLKAEIFEVKALNFRAAL